MANIASLAIQFTARTGNLTKGIKSSGKSVGGFGKKVAGATVAVAKYGAALVTAGAGALAFFIKRQFSAIDATAKFSASLLVSVGALEGYKLAARITGASNELIIKSMQVLQKRMGEVSQNIGEGKNALKSLGIEFESIKDLSLEKQLEVIADGMGNIKLRTEQASIANQLFGRGGKDLLIFLDQGSAGIRGFIDEAKELGLSFSAVDGRKVEDANDAIVRLKSSITGVVRGLAIFVAPVVEKLATLIKDNIVSARKSAISSFNEMKDGIIARLTAIIKIGLPIIILWARGAIAWFTLVGKVIFAVVEGIITVVVFLANSLNLLSEIAFGQGIIDNFKDILIAAQFIFKNIGRIVEVATLFIATRFFEMRDSVLSVFNFMFQAAVQVGQRIKLVFDTLTSVASLDIADFITDTGKIDAISKQFIDIAKPFKEIEPIASKAAKTSRLAFETELKGLGNAFQDFRKKELEGAGDLTQKFLDFFKFKLPKLDLTESATSTIQAFGQDKTLQALEAGTAEALKVERKSQDNVEKNTKDMVSEQQKTNMLIQKLVDLPQVESELRGIE